MAAETGEKQLLIITAAAFGVLVVALGACIFWGNKTLTKIKAESEKVQKQRTVKLARLAELKGEKKRNQVLKARSRLYNKFLIQKSEEVPAVRDAISLMSQQAGLHMVGVTLATNKLKPTDPAEKITYSWEFIGSFDQIGQFVSSIEDVQSVGRLINIAGISIASIKQGYLRDVEGDRGHTLNLTMTLYKWKDTENK
jgi:Tfp pilus assembly protein PilO